MWNPRRTGSLLLLLTVLVGLPRAGYGETLTFDMTPREVLGSVARYGAFLASLGKRARGVKLVEGGTSFAGQACAGFGEVYALGSVTVLDGPDGIGDLVQTRRGRDAALLASVFAAANVASWKGEAVLAETNVAAWSATDAAHGVRFSAEGLDRGSDAGLIDARGATGVFRFRVDVQSAPDASGRHRFLLELRGRTPSNDGGLVMWAERRCFTFVELEAVDPIVLVRLVHAFVTVPTLRVGLLSRLAGAESALARGDTVAAADSIAAFVSYVVSLTPGTLTPAQARRLIEAAYHVRRGFRFVPATSNCGNGERESGEACDGSDLGGFDCQRLGFQGGALKCRPDCRFDTSACTGTPVCGNGILEPGEQCDNGAANSNSVPDACRTNCRRAYCGDGVIDSFEDCEGRNLAGATCRSEGFDRGTLRCDADCSYDYDACFDDDE